MVKPIKLTRVSFGYILKALPGKVLDAEAYFKEEVFASQIGKKGWEMLPGDECEAYPVPTDNQSYIVWNKTHDYSVIGYHQNTLDDDRIFIKSKPNSTLIWSKLNEKNS